MVCGEPRGIWRKSAPFFVSLCSTSNNLIMKEMLLIIFSFITIELNASITPYANFGEYGIEYCASESEFQKYVGSVVQYYPSTLPSKFDKDFKGDFNHLYTIEKITGRAPKYKMILKDNSNASIVELVFYTEYKYRVNDDIIYCVKENSTFTLPILLVNKFEEKRDKTKGQILKYQGKDLFEIEDLQIGYIKGAVSQIGKTINVHTDITWEDTYGNYPTINAKLKFLNSNDTIIARYSFLRDEPYLKELQDILIAENKKKEAPQLEEAQKKLKEQHDNYLKGINCYVNLEESQEIQRVYETKGSQDEIYSKLQAWITANYNSYKSVVETEDKSVGRIILKGFSKLQEADFNLEMPYKENTLHYRITLECKVGKYRISVDNLDASYYDSFLERTHHDKIPTLVFAIQKATPEISSLTHRAKIQIEECNKELGNLLSSLYLYMKKDNKKDEDW